MPYQAPRPSRFVPTDTSISLDTNNKSAESILTTYTWPNNQIANAILMKFDLSQLPAGASIQDATLSMALVESDSASDPTYTVTAHKIINRNPVINAATGYTFNGSANWDPASCCYSGIPLGQADISTAYDTKAIDKATGFKTWSLTRMVQEWQTNPSSNFGVLLNSDATKPQDRYRFFASTENTNASLRPFLRVTVSGTTSGSGGTGGTGGTTPPPPTPDTTAPDRVDDEPCRLARRSLEQQCPSGPTPATTSASPACSSSSTATTSAAKISRRRTRRAGIPPAPRTARTRSPQLRVTRQAICARRRLSP
jgi:hypothetical protein